MTTTEFVVKKGPNKLDLMLALFDKDERGPRFVSFQIQGEWYRRWPKWRGGFPTWELFPPTQQPTAYKRGELPTDKERERVKQEPYLMEDPQWMGATIDSVVRVFGEDDTWDVIGTTQGTVMAVLPRIEDRPFRARISTKTRKGKVWFDPPQELDPMKGLRG